MMASTSGRDVFCPTYSSGPLGIPPSPVPPSFSLPPSGLMSHPAPEDSVPSTPPAPDNGSIGEDNAPLQPPTPLTNLTPLGASPRDSVTPSANAPLVPQTEKSLEENVVDQPEHRKSPFLRRAFWLALVAIVVLIVLVVFLPVYFTVIKPKNTTASGISNNPDHSSSQPTPTSNPENPKSPKGLTTGGDGSTVTTDNGTQFTYHNPFGGFCACILFTRTGEGRQSYILNRRVLGSGTPVHR